MWLQKEAAADFAWSRTASSYPESPLVLCVTGFVTSVTRMSRRLTMIVDDV